MKKQTKKKPGRPKKIKSDVWTSGCSKHKETGVEVHFNNSGGRWWLNQADEVGLEKEGFRLSRPDGQWSRMLGDHINYAFIPCNSMQEGLDAFRRATQYTGRELGCFSCCGPPFSFTFYKNGEQQEYWSPSAPDEGSDY